MAGASGRYQRYEDFFKLPDEELQKLREEKVRQTLQKIQETKTRTYQLRAALNQNSNLVVNTASVFMKNVMLKAAESLKQTDLGGGVNSGFQDREMSGDWRSGQPAPPCLGLDGGFHNREMSGDWKSGQPAPPGVGSYSGNQYQSMQGGLDRYSQPDWDSQRMQPQMQGPGQYQDNCEFVRGIELPRGGNSMSGMGQANMQQNRPARWGNYDDRQMDGRRQELAAESYFSGGMPATDNVNAGGGGFRNDRSGGRGQFSSNFSSGGFGEGTRGAFGGDTGPGFGNRDLSSNDGFGNRDLRSNDGFGNRNLSSNDGFGNRDLRSNDGFGNRDLRSNDGFGNRDLRSNDDFGDSGFREGGFSNSRDGNDGFGNNSSGGGQYGYDRPNDPLQFGNKKDQGRFEGDKSAEEKSGGGNTGEGESAPKSTGPKGGCWICGEKGHFARKCPKKDEEDDDQEEEDTSSCELCKVSFDNPQKYYSHIRGLLHIQRQLAASNSQSGGQAAQDTSGEKTGPTFCKVCIMTFDTPQKYEEHTQGMLHSHRVLARQNKKQEGEKNQVPATGGTETNAGEEEEMDDWEEEWEEEEDASKFVCELCDIKCTGIQAFRSHEAGKNHKLVQEAVEFGTSLPARIYSKLGPKAKIPSSAKPAVATVRPTDGPSVLLDLLKAIPEAIVGTEFVKEGRAGKNPSFYCMTCDSSCDMSGIITHLMGAKHRMKYLRDHHPSVYQHVRSHGGKRSQLSAFLEEVCSDIEKQFGRKEPMMDRPEGCTKKTNPEKTDPEKKESEKKEPEKEGSVDKDEQEKTKEDSKDETKDKEGNEEKKMKKTEKKEEENKQKGNNQKAQKVGWHGQSKRNLDHDEVMARYRETKAKGLEGGPPMGSGDGWNQGPGFRFGPHAPPGQMGPGFNRDMQGPNNPFFGPMHSRPMEQGPMDPGFPGPPGPPGPAYFDHPGIFGSAPSFRDMQPELLSEEESRRRMLEFERRAFYFPDLVISPEEARRQFFFEYESLGVPYSVACDRVLVQENRRMSLIDYMEEGLTLKEAQDRVLKIENRKQLIREYELQGLDPREARWRVIVEEERRKLFDNYERLGFTPLQARIKISDGEDRQHLIQEFERHGMTPEEAHRRAIAEENRLKNLDSSVSRASDQDQKLDDIADKRLLQSYMEQGDSRDTAENKVIAALRRQGVSTQDAILRVQKIEIQLPKKSEQPEAQPKSKKSEDLDTISPAEAKERLFQEYERRGVPREKARVSLIQELIKSGVSEEEAKKRFSDTKPLGSDKRKGEGEKERGRKRGKYTGYEQRNRHSSRSPSSSGSSPKEPKGKVLPKAFQEGRDRGKQDRGREDRGKEDRAREDRGREDRGREDRGRFKEDTHRAREDRERAKIFEEIKKKKDEFSFRERDRIYQDMEFKSKGSKADSVDKDKGRPTLTLGEELKLKARKLKRDELLSQLEEKSALAKSAKFSAAQTSTSTSLSQTTATPAAAAAYTSTTKDSKDISGLLESLTDNLISSDGNESVALSMSKVLTSALLKYRGKSGSAQKEKAAAGSASSSSSSFIQRRIDDAKRLYETKMAPKAVTAESFGLPPPVSNYNVPPPQQYNVPPPQQYNVPPPQQYNVPPQQYNVQPPQHYNVPPPHQYGAQPPQQYGALAPVNAPPRNNPPASFQQPPEKKKKSSIPQVLLSQKEPKKGHSSSLRLFRR